MHTATHLYPLGAVCPKFVYSIVFCSLPAQAWYVQNNSTSLGDPSSPNVFSLFVGKMLKREGAVDASLQQQTGTLHAVVESSEYQAGGSTRKIEQKTSLN